MSLSDQNFTTLLVRLENDTDVLGAFLSGSRGKGFATAHSDYDVIIIVREDARETCQERYPFRYRPDIDCVVHDLSGFHGYATYDSPEAWDRYDFAHVEILFDRTGKLLQLIDAKGRLPTERRGEVLRGSLDAYINGLYRSLKCLRNVNALGARLEAAVSISALLTFLFALEGRHSPFPGYLQQELTHYPITGVQTEQLLLYIDRISATADLEAQQALLRLVDKLAVHADLSDVLADWGDDYRWMQTLTLHT